MADGRVACCHAMARMAAEQREKIESVGSMGKTKRSENA